MDKIEELVKSLGNMREPSELIVALEEIKKNKELISTERVLTDVAISALKQVDGERWHDLRKNKNDIPENEELVMVRSKYRCFNSAEYRSEIDISWFFAGRFILRDKFYAEFDVIEWKRI